MNLQIVRARAGIIHIIVWLTMIITLYHDYPVKPILYYQFYDFVICAVFGLTPLSLSGGIAYLITMHVKPKWKGVKPLQLAWTMGATMVICCFVTLEFIGRRAIVPL